MPTVDSRHFSSFIVVCTGFGSAWLILHFGIALPIFTQSLDSPNGAALLSASVLAACLGPAWLQRPLVFCILVIGFAFALAELWHSAASTGPVIGGLLPSSDARSYLLESSLITEGQRMTSWGSRRPLSGSYLAGLLWLSGGNLRFTVVLLGLLVCFAASLALVEIRLTSGPIATALAAFVLARFYQRFVGTTLSESCGLAYGAIAFALLLRAWRGRNAALLATGGFMLALGLNARAGAFFVLPILLLAAWWRWRPDWAAGLKAAAFCGLAIAIAFAANVGMFKAFGAKEGQMFSNVGVTLYGVIHDGDWTTVYAEHTELRGLPESEQNSRVLAMVWNEVKAHPGLAWNGVLRSWREFFTPRPLDGGPFSYMGSVPLEKALQYLALAGALFALCTLGRRAESSIVLAGMIGTVLSLPFAPPWDADRMRAYAATMPLIALCAGYGLAAPFLVGETFLNRTDSPKPDGRPAVIGLSLLGCGAVVLAVQFVFPALAKFCWPHPPLARASSYSGRSKVSLEIRTGNYVTVSDGGSAPSIVPNIHRRDLVANMGFYRGFWPRNADYLDKVTKQPVSLFSAASAGLTLLVLKPRPYFDGQRLDLDGDVIVFPDGCFFVEDALPHPPSG